MSTEVTRSGPLGDLRVLDLTRLLPGGYLTLLLADLGADVLKVEDTGLGDYIRWWPPLYGDDSNTADGTRAAAYLALNRGKRSMQLDLKNERGRDVLKRLVRGHDVLIESFRPGVMERLGVGYDALAEENEGLVYCAITGYGQTGPLRDRAAHDMNILALNGLFGLSGDPGGRPVQAAGQIADLGGGSLMAAVGILAALRERDRTGRGQYVDASMFDGSLSWAAMIAAGYFCDGKAPDRGEYLLTGAVCCYFDYETADGRWMTLGALEPKFWRAWCAGVGREDLLDKQFESPRSETGRAVAAVFAGRTMDEWIAFSHDHDCCLEPVLDLGEALESEQVAARRMVVEVDQEPYGRVRQLGIPIKLSRLPDAEPSPAPRLGQHTRDALRDAGFGDAEIEELKADDAVAVGRG